jgi:putative ABC transport system permease protein
LKNTPVLLIQRTPQKHIEDTWDKFTANDPFQYFFLDEEFNNIYHEEKRTGKMSLGFAVLSVFIALIIAFLTVFYTVYMAASKNPVRSLQYE